MCSTLPKLNRNAVFVVLHSNPRSTTSFLVKQLRYVCSSVSRRTVNGILYSMYRDGAVDRCFFGNDCTPRWSLKQLSPDSAALDDIGSLTEKDMIRFRPFNDAADFFENGLRECLDTFQSFRSTLHPRKDSPNVAAYAAMGHVQALHAICADAMQKLHAAACHAGNSSNVV
jgi:hypothetical protein